MKIKLLLALMLTAVMYQAEAQKVPADLIKTNSGMLKVQPITHASLILTWNNKTIYVDPTGEGTLYAGNPAPDLILITDIHGDHMDPKAILAVNTKNAIIIAPQAVADALPAGIKEKVTVLKNDAKTQQLGMTITAIPMYNIPESTTAFHTKGRGNGYVINAGGKNIYISGDTQGIPEMLALKNIDVAFLCMNLPYTMEIKEAAKATLAFKPAIVYPYHYRGQDVEAYKKLVNAGNPKIDVRLKNWYPAN
jgi:L-ascorbate metabolism protein UlaG (beta-lactamase superfamily)